LPRRRYFAILRSSSFNHGGITALVQDIVFQSYAPIGSPDRSEKAKKANEPVLLDDPKVIELAKKYNKTPGQVLWLLLLSTISIEVVGFMLDFRSCYGSILREA